MLTCDIVTRVRDKVADAAAVELHAAILSH